MTSTARSLLPLAAAGFGRRVHAVAPDGWNARTPCEKWSVRDLVSHLVVEHLWAVPLLDGATIADVGDRFSGDVLGEDPVEAWDAAITASLERWARADDDDLVHLSMGPGRAGDYAEQMLLDLTVHAWDLARGAGADDRLDPAAVAHVLSYVRPQADRLSGYGIFAPPVPVDSDDPQDQMLALLGRRP